MDILVFIVFLGAAFGAGATGALFPPGAWYQDLSKPWFTPPNWVFPVMWTSIYLLIAFAGARVAGQPGSGLAMAFWSAQIAVNALWSPVFFGLRRLGGAIPIIMVLWLMVLGASITHWQVDVWAGLAFLPYLIWVTIAMALNIGVWRLNPSVKPISLNEQT